MWTRLILVDLLAVAHDLRLLLRPRDAHLLGELTAQRLHLLPQPPRLGHLLVPPRLYLDGLGALGVAQGAVALLEVLPLRRDVGDHHGERVAAERLLQHLGG